MPVSRSLMTILLSYWTGSPLLSRELEFINLKPLAALRVYDSKKRKVSRHPIKEQRKVQNIKKSFFKVEARLCQV